MTMGSSLRDQERLEHFMQGSHLEQLLPALQSTKNVTTIRDLGRLSEKDLVRTQAKWHLNQKDSGDMQDCMLLLIVKA